MDCKTLIPVLISFLENFEHKYESMFSNMKEELLSGLTERDGKIDGLESEVSVSKNALKKTNLIRGGTLL